MKSHPPDFVYVRIVITDLWFEQFLAGFIFLSLIHVRHLLDKFRGVVDIDDLHGDVDDVRFGGDYFVSGLLRRTNKQFLLVLHSDLQGAVGCPFKIPAL